jgi:hypothetical protein
MWIRATKLCSWIDPDTRRGYYFTAGQMADLPPEWCAKFISEDTAEACDDPEPPAYADPHIPPSLGDGPLTVACVHKTGGKYDRADYVGKLARAVERHLTLPHRFVCLSDGRHPDVEVIPLEKRWPGYWSKIEIHRPGLFTGPLLYLDLDTVISGSIDELAAIPDPLVLAWDLMRGWVNSSFLLTRVDLSCVWAAMNADPKAVIAEYDSGEGPHHGDQGLLQDVLARERIPWRWVQSIRPHQLIWSAPGLRGSPPPNGTRVEMWYGDPKQPEVGGAWLAQHWH